MARPLITVEVDWAGDGMYAHAASDVSRDLMKDSLSWFRGRPVTSRRRANAGFMNFNLWNNGGKYDPYNTSGSISGVNVSGIGVRCLMDSEVVWTGLMDKIDDQRNPRPHIKVRALGRLAFLDQVPNIPSQASTNVGDVAKLLAGQAGVVDTYLKGTFALGRWYSDKPSIGEGLHELEEVSQSYLFERADGELQMDSPSDRRTGTNANSILDLVDDVSLLATDFVPLIKGTQEIVDDRFLNNLIAAPFTPLSVGSSRTLWSSVITVPGNGEIIVFADYPTADSPTTHVGIAAVTGVSGAGLTITREVESRRVKLTVQNTGGSPRTSTITVTGTPLVAADSLAVERQDATSVAAYGEREYPIPATILSTLGEAEAYGDAVVTRRKDPFPWIVANWPAHYNAARARTVEISNRVTTCYHGAMIEHHVEGIGMRIQNSMPIMEYVLSQVPGATAPRAPVITFVGGVSGQPGQLAVTWGEPFDGGDAITGYEIEFREVGTATWMAGPDPGTNVTAIITLPDSDRTEYQVQVRAINSIGESLWSQPLSGRNANVYALFLDDSGNEMRLYTAGISTFGLTQRGSDVSIGAGDWFGGDAFEYNGAVYALVVDNGSNEARLYTIDLSTFALTQVGSDVSLGGGSWQGVGAFVLNDVVYAMFLDSSGNDVRLYTVDVSTFSLTQVGSDVSLGSAFWAGATAFVDGGTAYALLVENSDAHLYTVDTSTFGLTEVDSAVGLGTGSWQGVGSFVAGGTVYALFLDASPREARLYTIDLSTFSLTQVGSDVSLGSGSWTGVGAFETNL